MIPLRLKLTGAVGIQAGLNRKALELDFERFDTDTQVVAIRGDNGSGKSTLLNLGMVPWLNPPVPGNIYDHFGPEGIRELEWEHGGTRYRSEIRYRQTAKTKSTKAALYRHNGQGWESYRAPDGTPSDGKASTYEHCVESILGTQSLYYISAFRAQGAPRLAEYDDPKGLMRDLLRLDVPAGYAESARLVARDLRREYDAVKALVDSHAINEAALADLQDQIVTDESRIDALTSELEHAQAAHAIATAELAKASDVAVEAARIEDQRSRLGRNIAALITDIDAAKAQHITRLREIDARHNHAKNAAASRIRALHQDIANADARIARHQALLADEEDIRAAAASLDNMKADEADAAQLVAELSATVQRKRDALLQRTDIHHHIQRAIAEQDSITRRVDDLSRRAGYVDAVPCHGEGEYAACPALADAIHAAQRIPSEQEALTAAEISKSELELRQAEADALIASFGDCDTKLQTATEARERIAKQIRTAGVRASLLPQLDAAGFALIEEQMTIDAKKADIQAAQADIAQADTDRSTAVAALNAEHETLIADKTATLTELRDELAGLPTLSTEAVDQARAKLANANRTLSLAQSAIEQHNATQAQRQAKATALTQEIAHNADAVDRAKRIEAEVATWTLLSAAMRGVVDLSIEDAGPAISAIANDLLREAYGPRFTIQLVSQREQANGKLVECFDVQVIDADSGITSSILHKSGGENVWLDKALSDAVGIYHQDAAGTTYECLFADEAEDGLTQERKAQFYRMDRRALAVGNYRRKFFVSHNPDAWSMADAVIDLEHYKNGATA